MSRQTGREIDSGQIPEWSEFLPREELGTQVRPRDGFFLGPGDWRFRAVDGILYFDHWSGSAWVEQGRLEV